MPKLGFMPGPGMTCQAVSQAELPPKSMANLVGRASPWPVSPWPRGGAPAVALQKSRGGYRQQEVAAATGELALRDLNTGSCVGEGGEGGSVSVRARSSTL